MTVSKYTNKIYKIYKIIKISNFICIAVDVPVRYKNKKSVFVRPKRSSYCK